jgi:AhpD family alkylhydroperoxidase
MTTTTPSRVDIAKDARDLYRAYCALDRAVNDSALDPRLADLVKLRASQLNGCAYCVDQHSSDAQKAGEEDRRLFAVSAWRESPLFSDRERAALALTEALTRLRHDSDLDGVYDQAAEYFDAPELAALLYAIVTINGWNRLAVATHMVYEA